jgi:hypothetical protein
MMPTLLLAAALAAAEASGPPPPLRLDVPPRQPVLGCWRDESDASRLLRLDPHRLVRVEQGIVVEVLRVARYARGQVVLDHVAFPRPIHVAMLGGTLVVHDEGPGGARTHVRIDCVDSQFELRAAEVAEALPQLPGRVEAVRAELLRHEAALEAARRRDPADPAEIARSAATASHALRAMLREVGFIDTARFGAEAARAAREITQQSTDLSLRKAMLPCVEAEARSDPRLLRDVAVMLDRLLVLLALRQRYGTQARLLGDGRRALMPVEDLAAADAAWRAMGVAGGLAGYHGAADLGSLVVLEWAE